MNDKVGDEGILDLSLKITNVTTKLSSSSYAPDSQSIQGADFQHTQTQVTSLIHTNSHIHSHHASEPTET